MERSITILEMKKICFICKLAINTEKDKYLKISEFEGKTKISTLHCHRICHTNIMTGKKGLATLQGMAAKFIQNLNKKYGGEEEVII